MKKIIANEENAGVRIDKFLAKEFFLYSRGEISREIKDGEVYVDGKRVKPSYVLQNGDEIFVKNLLIERNFKPEANGKIKIEVIFEDENILAINKPAGIQVHPSNVEKKNTIVNWLLAKYPTIEDVHDGSREAFLRPGIVHRLDKETSGIMIVAKKIESFNELKKLFEERKIEKKYLAICEGIFENDNGKIDNPIAKSADYQKQVIARQNTKTKIKSALTFFRVIERFSDYSLIEALPKTGRTHQIRIHFSSIGHPIVGDKIYGKDSNSDAQRQLLHAKSLKFELFGKMCEFEAPLPEDFVFFLSQKRQNINIASKG